MLACKAACSGIGAVGQGMITNPHVCALCCLCRVQVFDFWPKGLAGVARKHRSALGFLVGRWGTPVPRQVPLFLVSSSDTTSSTALRAYRPSRPS